MEKILSELDDIADRISNLRGKREKLADFLGELKGVEIRDDEILENRISISVNSSDLEDMDMVGVDGGLVKRPYHAIDLVLTKAVAASFHYDGDLKEVNYVPDAIPTPKLTVFTEPYSNKDFSLAANLERMHIEIDLVSEVCEKEPNIIMLDGSIVPHPSSRPEDDSPVYEKYEELLGKYSRVFDECNSLLVGVSEDSRSKRLSGIISEKILSSVDDKKAEELKGILNTTRDSNLLFHVLDKGERSFCFTYSKDGDDSVPFIEDVYSFYLKTTEFDRPVRVDFYCEDSPVETADQIASMVLPVSSQNEEYGMPAPIIEADSRASMKEEELDFIHSTLQDKVGHVSSLYSLRRNNRPF